MPGPLAGYRIIDATQMISGPMATMLLADQGADVIKVEPPGIGDLTRALGRGKRASSAVKTKQLREVGRMPAGAFALDFQRAFAGIAA
jgi:crotonobetainyl-CoA:carnitine CoA-transferase CaiB-like acyl-CoA transferase